MKLLKERQAKEAQEATLNRILGADGSRKRKEEKETRKREDRTAVRRLRGAAPAEGFLRRVQGPSGSRLIFSEGQRPYWETAAAPPPAKTARS